MKNTIIIQKYYFIKLICKNAFDTKLLTLLAFVFIACDGFVDVDLPNSQLAASEVFEEKSTANAAMTQVYAKMRDGGLFTGYATGLSNLLGNYTDELAFYGTAQEGTVNFYNNVVLPSNSSVKSIWNSSYNQIYGANAVLEGVTASQKLPDSDRRQLMGEALFTRALIHFYLTGIYGNIPYVSTTEYQTNRSLAKESSGRIYLHCIDDLKRASGLLSESYIAPDRTRPNRSAARALLARVYLYTQQWAESSNEASAVLNNTGLYTYENNLSKTFLKGSQATIWQFSANTAIGNTLEAQTFIFSSGPPAITALSPFFLSSFQNGDLRRTLWITSVTNGITSWHYPSKYKNKGTGTSTEFSIILRLSEIYLVRAEARAHAGDLIGSKEDINKIRHSAGLADTPAVSQNEILNALLQERRHELFTELGHRFFDLKRFGSLDTELFPVKPQWQTFKSELPLPETELILNSNLNPQNTGY